jgi:hypothetical protein
MSLDRRRFLMVGAGVLAAGLPGRNMVFAEEAAGVHGAGGLHHSHRHRSG